MVGRCKLFHYRAFCKGNVVFIGGDYFIRIFLCGLFYHLEEGRFLFHTVDDKRAAEDFVTAVFRIDLCKTEYFRIGQFTAQVVFYLFQIVHFFLGKSKSFLFIVRF